jgi:hypothetical protein
MRDIVSEVGTFYRGLSQLQTLTSSQYSAAISAATIGKYDGFMVYILSGTYTSSATMAVTIQVSNDSGGSPVSNNWTNIPVTDQVVWTATSASDYTPVRQGNVTAPTITVAAPYNQRIGYLGTTQTFTANSSPGDGLSYTADWFRVASTYGGSGNALIEVIIVLGRPRHMPSDV